MSNLDIDNLASLSDAELIQQLTIFIQAVSESVLLVFTEILLVYQIKVNAFHLRRMSECSMA